jgi:hypothetical protein
MRTRSLIRMRLHNLAGGLHLCLRLSLCLRLRLGSLLVLLNLGLDVLPCFLR